MRTESETRRVAFDLCERYGLDFNEVYQKISKMTTSEFATFKSDLQSERSNRTLRDG